jgi:hypothetical protein
MRSFLILYFAVYVRPYRAFSLKKPPVKKPPLQGYKSLFSSRRFIIKNASAIVCGFLLFAHPLTP